MNVSITGLGAYDPPMVVDNEMLASMVDTSDEWITTRTGIRRRHVSAGETVLDMAEKASRQAIESSGLAPEAISLVIVASSSPDNLFPMAAAMLRERLGLPEGPSFDLSGGCTGLVCAMAAAASMMEAMGYGHALVVGSEMLTRLVDWTDRATCVLFGDGAGAYVLSRGGGGIKALYLNSRSDVDGALAKNVYPARNPWIAEQAFDDRFRMSGQDVFRFAVEAVPEAVTEAARLAGRQLSDIDWVIPHQANLRIIESAAKRLGLPMEKFYVNIDSHGNTGAASIPIAMNEMRQKGLLLPGQNIVEVAFGAGFAWGSAWIEWK